MSTIGMRELARHASSIINDIEQSKEPALVTRRGRPVVYMLPVDSGRPQCGCPRTALVPAAGGWQNVEGCLMSFLSCSSPTEPAGDPGSAHTIRIKVVCGSCSPRST